MIDKIPTESNSYNNDASNRFELLLFYLGNRRRFGINVLKVKEVISCPPLNQLPAANPNILGVLMLRADTFPIIHLAKAIKTTRQGLTAEEMSKGSIITTEMNRRTEGFWISKVDKIVVIDWKDVQPPSQKQNGENYTTGITLIDDELVQIIDIEKVLAEVLNIEISHKDVDVSDNILDSIRNKLVLIVDDSPMAVKQTVKALDILGLDHIVAEDGLIALNLLKGYGPDKKPIDMIISDIEMPEMDGYTFVNQLRKLPKYKDIHVLMHTSLNGQMNLQRAISAGANDILTKFVPSELAEKIVSHLLDNEH
jgi:two-component system chemotaxis response regulator CheV